MFERCIFMKRDFKVWCLVVSWCIKWPAVRYEGGSASRVLKCFVSELCFVLGILYYTCGVWWILISSGLQWSKLRFQKVEQSVLSTQTRAVKAAHNIKAAHWPHLHWNQMVKILLHGDVLLFNDMFNGSCFVHFICTSYYYILHPATHANRGAMTGEICIAVWLLHKWELWAGKSQERLGALHKVLHNVLHNILHCTMFCTMCFWPSIQCHEVQNYIWYKFALFDFCTKRGREKVFCTMHS